MTAELVVVLGRAAALGIDPSRLLRADPVEAPLLARALEHAAKMQGDRDEALAKRIIAELASAMKRGGRKG